MEADGSRPGATRADDHELVAIARASIAAHYGLSEAQSRRLVGQTAAELRADARLVARELGIAVDDDDDGDGVQRDEHGRFAGRDMNKTIRAASGRA
jgi:hypothetical protein